MIVWLTSFTSFMKKCCILVGYLACVAASFSPLPRAARFSSAHFPPLPSPFWRLPRRLWVINLYGSRRSDEKKEGKRELKGQGIKTLKEIDQDAMTAYSRARRSLSGRKEWKDNRYKREHLKGNPVNQMKHCKVVKIYQ